MTEIRHMRSSLAMALALILTVFSANSLAQATGASAQAGKPAKAGKAAPTTPINLNTATAVELEALPGVGPATAARIVEYRQKQGGFKKIEDLMNVRGVGEKMFLSLKPLIVVTPGKGVWL
jgi:competence protein ComEA